MHSINLYLLLTHTLITSLLANPVPVTNHTSTPNNARRSYFTPVREPEMHPVECHDEAEFRGHADIKPKFFFEGVYKFCQERYDTTQVLDASDDPTNPAYHDGNGRLARNASWRYRDWHGVNHDFRVWWEAGCRVTVGKQSVRRPLGEEGGPVWTPGCYEIMGSTHYECEFSLFWAPPIVVAICDLGSLPRRVKATAALVEGRKSAASFTSIKGERVIMTTRRLDEEPSFILQDDGHDEPCELPKMAWSYGLIGQIICEERI
ncbi:uncharacterized protein CLUP02_08490 [Colletotrichum lupini]|uniref:Uncharacterized protein n=1 Tax=Colletotrichum lupini TaxID=145971 RepID=A0A9Q8WHP1_9PEZI|nr:uncharacterized protein CLUP02_08490 [Colletotrichum lupini]UQC83000.1 hypothetical protein CLUP02_08490 [Colletotrichum lupini]